MSEQTSHGFEPIPLGGRPGADLSAIGLLPPLPKPAQPVEPRTPPKPPEPPAVKSAVVEVAKPPVPGKLAWMPEALRMLVKPTRQKGVIAAGLASLACGALIANYMWPAPKPPAPDVVKVEPAPAPTPAPESTPGLDIPKIEVPAVPAPAASIPAVIIPDPAPMGNVATAAPPLIQLPPLPGGKNDEQVKPAGGVPDIPLPPMPAPAAPAIPEVKLPEVTAMVVPPPVKLPDLKSPPAAVPEVKAATTPPPAIAIPESKPVATPPIPDPAATIPLPKIEVAPPPAIPDMPKKPEVNVAPPKIDVSPLPAAVAEAPKPAPLPEVKPAAGMSPREDYDVDVHYPKGGDTWTSISKDVLGDDRYAEALRAYNGGRALAARQGVDVPPIHVLRKNFAHLIGAAKSAEPAPVKPAAGQRMYEVPAGGLTLKELARKALGDENLWGQIWEMNPKLRADEPVPGGTKVKLPADARIGE